MWTYACKLSTKFSKRLQLKGSFVPDPLTSQSAPGLRCGTAPRPPVMLALLRFYPRQSPCLRICRFSLPRAHLAPQLYGGTQWPTFPQFSPTTQQFKVVVLWLRCHNTTTLKCCAVEPVDGSFQRYSCYYLWVVHNTTEVVFLKIFQNKYTTSVVLTQNDTTRTRRLVAA